MSFTTLPSEILNQILAHLTKWDIRRISVVCKSWKEAVSCYLGKGVEVSVRSNQFERLNKDLVCFPCLAKKVSKLTVTYGSKNDLPFLRDILKQCPNLLALKFTGESPMYEYLKLLQSPEISLPKIQHIESSMLDICSRATNRFYIWINFRFRATVESLCFVDIPRNGALRGYGGLNVYISYFHHLTTIIIDGNGFELQLDLHGLLQASHTLQSISIWHNYRIKCDITESETPTYADYSSLKKFCLCGGETDINLMKYIMSRFKTLELFAFDNLLVTPNESLTDDEDKKILQGFKSFPATSKTVSFVYKGYTYKSTQFAQNDCYLFDGVHEDFSWKFQQNAKVDEKYDVQL